MAAALVGQKVLCVLVGKDVAVLKNVHLLTVLPVSVLLCRCSRQYRGKDATSGVCPEQKESLGSAKPKPLSAQ